MRKHLTIAVTGAAALALGLGACSTGGTGNSESAETIQKTIKAQEAKWQADLKAKNTEGLAGQYSRDAYLASSTGVADGSTAIRKMFAEGTSDPAFKMQFASDKIDVARSGDLAYSRGHFTEQYTDPKSSKVMSHSGSYLSVYKKQDDGRWQMVADFAVADPATQKVVPPATPPVRAKMVSF